MKHFLVFILGWAMLNQAQAAVEDIQSMVRNSGRFDVICSDGSTDFVPAAQIRSNQVCSNGNSQVSAFEACESVFTGQANEDTCFASVRRYRMVASQVLACEPLFNNDASELLCVESAGKNNLSAQAIDVCETMFNNDTYELKCLDLAINLSAGALTACEEGFNNDTNELLCIEGAGLTGLDEAGIRFCLDRFNGDSAELKCIRGE